ncbi:MAG: WD40/YVTN/BNR-like repeat-containing protein [Actinomycetota bacterium]
MDGIARPSFAPARGRSRMLCLALGVVAFATILPGRAVVPGQGWTPSSFGLVPSCAKYNPSGALFPGCTFTRRIRFHPSIPGLAYVGTLHTGPWVSTNGSAWAPLAPQCLSELYTVDSTLRQTTQSELDVCSIEEIAFDPADSRVIYATGYDVSSPLLPGVTIDPGGVYRSDNLGTSWTKVSKTVPNLRGAALAVARRAGQPPTIIAGAIQHASWDIGTSKSLWISNDGGARWRSVVLPAIKGCNTKTFLSTPLLVATLYVHPRNPDVVYAATNGGLYQTSNRGRTWAPILSACITKPISMGIAWGVAVTPDGKTIYAGLWDGRILMSPTTGTSQRTWRTVATLDGTFVSHLLIDARDRTGKTLYAAALNKRAGKTNLSAGVYRVRLSSPSSVTLLPDSWASGVNHSLGELPRGPYNLVKDAPAYWLAQSTADPDLLYLSQAAGGVFWRSEGAPSPVPNVNPNGPPPAPPALPPLPTATPTLGRR